MVQGVMLISITRPDWDAFLTWGQAAIKRSVSTSLDAAKVKPDGVASYISALGEFHREGTHPVEALRKDSEVLRHVYASFLVMAPRELYFGLSARDLQVLFAEDTDVAIVSGRMDDWVDATVSILKSASPLQELACCFVKAFEVASLGECWADYQKVSTGELFLLARKR